MSRTCSDGSADDSSLVSSSSGDPTKAVIYNRNGTKCITIVKTQVSPSQPEEGSLNLELPSGHTTSITKKKKRKNKKSLDCLEEESLVGNSYSGGDEILLETHSTTPLPQERISLSSPDKQSCSYSQTTAPKVKPLAQHKNAGKKDDGIWSIDIEEERKRIRTFWLQLSEEERKTLVKVERNTVLKKMREQKNRVCPCSICGKRRKKAQEARGTSIDVRYNRDSGDNHQDPTAKSLETDEYSDEEEAMVYPPPNVYLDLENDLKIEEDGMVTVADDLIKNDGEKFLVMMEKLAEQQVELKESECETNGCCDEHGPKEPGLYDEEEEKLDMTTKRSIEETCTGQSSPEDQRLEDRHIFQVLIARLFEQQVLQAYREKVANERQQRLLGEIEEEIRLKREKEEIRLKKKEKKKDKKRLSKERKEQLRLKNESEQLARAESAKAQKEEEKKKKDEEQQRRIKEKLQKEQERVQQEEVTREILKAKEIARLKMTLPEKLKDETNQHEESEKRDSHFGSDELTSQVCLQASTRNSSPETTNQVDNGNNSINNNGEAPRYPAIDVLDNSATDKLLQVAASPCIRPFYQQTAQSITSSSTIDKSDFNKATLHQFPISRGVPFETSDPFVHAKNEASQIGVALGGGQGLGFGLLANGSNDHAYPGFSLPTWNSNAGVDTKIIRPPKSKAVSRPAPSRKFSHDLGSTEPTSRDFNALSSTTSSFSLAHIWDSPSKDNSSSPSQLSSASPVQESSFFTDHLFTEHTPHVSPQRHHFSPITSPTSHHTHDKQNRPSPHPPTFGLRFEDNWNDPQSENGWYRHPLHDLYCTDDSMIIWEQFRQVYFHLENTVAPYRSGYPGFYSVIELCQAHSELFKVPLVEYNRFHQICQIGNQMANASGGIFVFRRNFNQPNSEPLVRYEISSHVPHSTRFVAAPSFMDLGRQSQHYSWPYISTENSGFCMPPPQLQPTMQYQAQLNHIMKDSPSVPNSIFHLRQSYFQQPGYEHQNLDASNPSPTRDIAVKSALS